jgi:uncharacterized protein YukE
MSMRWYDKQQECEFCSERFESSRYDARFCSAKCRTANSRREKRRAEAEQGINTSWGRHAQNAYGEVTREVPEAAAAIKDLYVAHSAEAAADAVQVAYQVMTSVIARMEARLREKEQTIERLREDQAVLLYVKRYVNENAGRY